MTSNNTRRNKHLDFLQYLSRVQSQNDIRLSRPLNLFTHAFLNLNLAFTFLRGPKYSDCISPQSIQISNSAFEKTFSHTLTGLLKEILKDASEYKEKIRGYEEQNALRPEIPFDTETDYYNLITRDPVRIKEEHFLYQSLLEHENLLNQERFSCLDLGTGSGRLAFCMLDVLSAFYDRDEYEIYGMDISRKNLQNAYTKGAKLNIEFIQGDMSKTPFKNNLFSLCNVSSASYLVPYYERPFLLLEMCRILKSGGEGIITGINPGFSVTEYAKCMAASNLWNYFHPLNLYLAQQSAPTGLLVSEMCNKRKDFKPSDTRELCSALNFLGCEIKKAETWPQNSTIKDFYTGIHFKTTQETKEKVENIFFHQ